MTEYVKKQFSVKTGARRDCPAVGHWPRSTKSGYECVVCGQPCTVDGQPVGETVK